MEPRPSQRLGLAAILLAATFALYWISRPGAPTPAGKSSVPTATPAASTPAQAERRGVSPGSVAEKPRQSSPSPSVPPSPSAEVPAETAQPPDPAASAIPSLPVAKLRGEVEDIETMVRDFRNTVGENPVGTNAEITKALLGDNAKQVRMRIPAGSRQNENGELVDRWGTPYFFHQLSGTEMEVRSAGPDQQMWTGDDIKAK